jgi:hypothetical protein
MRQWDGELGRGDGGVDPQSFFSSAEEKINAKTANTPSGDFVSVHPF